MSITTTEIKDVVRHMSEIIIENETYFCELDSAGGDGDFGMSLSKGFKEILKQIDDIDDENPQRFLRGCAMIISEYCGGASGPIWSSAFSAAASSLKGIDTPQPTDIAAMLEAAIQGIQKRGGAARGEKTLLDALIPASEALEDAVAHGENLRSAFEKAAQAAAAGAEETKEMVASKGRASYVGERSLGSPDAGAAAIAVIFSALLA
jgi:dihydroxyacetone kinase